MTVPGHLSCTRWTEIVAVGTPVPQDTFMVTTRCSSVNFATGAAAGPRATLSTS